MGCDGDFRDCRPYGEAAAGIATALPAVANRPTS